MATEDISAVSPMPDGRRRCGCGCVGARAPLPRVATPPSPAAAAGVVAVIDESIGGGCRTPPPPLPLWTLMLETARPGSGPGMYCDTGTGSPSFAWRSSHAIQYQHNNRLVPGRHERISWQARFVNIATYCPCTSQLSFFGQCHPALPNANLRWRVAW